MVAFFCVYIVRRSNVGKCRRKDGNFSMLSFPYLLAVLCRENRTYQKRREPLIL